jgi:hypothetical protein
MQLWLVTEYQASWGMNVRVCGKLPMMAEHFAERHFAERTFCRRKFCRTDSLTNGQLAENIE